MAFNSIEEIIEDYRLGKMVLLVDDEDRENEGDLLLAADCCTPEAISFMAREARGLICLTLTDDHCQRLGLEQMVPSNGSVFSTAFTVSIEAAVGVTTGISAADRACTVAAAVAKDARAEDLVQPGHIFPLRAKEGGVLTRAGHTEAGCDLARLAGFTPASVIVEVMNDDGTMARRPDLEVFARKHGIKIGTIADLIHYRLSTEHTIERIGERELPTVHGTFRLMQAITEPLPSGWNEVSAKVVEVLFLGESQTCSVVTSGGTSMTVKALSAAGMPLKAGDPVQVRWATADACVYTEWTESDLNKAAGAH